MAPNGTIAFHDIVPDKRLRTGEKSGAYAGEVPIAWQLLRKRAKSHEFVADPHQDGKGIGAVEWDGQAWPFWPAESASPAER